MKRWLIAALCAGACSGSPDRPAPRAPDAASWRAARKWLSGLRAELTPAAPRVEQLSLSLFRMPAGPSLRARGAVAVHPVTATHPGAVRMILLGPGGTTAFDLWVCGDRYRLSIPAVDREEHGLVSQADEALPVAFLRWWFLRPLDGRLLATDVDRLMVRDEQGIFEVRRGGRDIAVERAGQRLRFERGGCGEARYERIGVLRIDIACTDRAGVPPERAFADPDDGSACGPPAEAAP